ncbi:uncharacterized protein TNCV_901391 [Trichonephila clavipes]|nr:uncharacterized protein TNCV_901391 [Trichonephila clavipes]
MSARHHLNDYDRGKAVGRLKVGQSVLIVASAMSVSNSVISRLKSVAEGGNALQKQARGRGMNTTPLKGRYATFEAKRSKSFTLGQIVANLTTNTGTHVSARTISRRLNKFGLFKRKLVPCIPLQPRHRRERLRWLQGFNLKNRKNISYPTIILSAIRPVPHGPDLPIPSLPDTLDNILDDLDQISHISSDSDDGYDPGTNDPELFSQSDLYDLARDLGLPKDTAEVLRSKLKERHLLNSGVSFSWYRFRENEFVSLFTQEGDLVFCNNVPAILEMFKIMYEPEE